MIVPKHRVKGEENGATGACATNVQCRTAQWGMTSGMSDGRGMRSWIRRLALGLLAVHVVLSATTFCWRKGRPLTDAELIQLATQDRISDVRERDPVLAAYLARAISTRADCCRVERLAVPRSQNNFWEKALRVLAGDGVSTVTLDFGLPPPGYGPWDPDLVAVTACGCIRDGDT